jgi:hypothetical protein
MHTVYLGNTLINDVMLGSQRMDDVFTPFTAAIELPPVTSGLVLYLDSTQGASYPGEGLSWYNLVAGQPITGSLQANVSFTTGPYLTGSYLQVTGSANGYIEIPGVNFTSSNSTVMCATRYTGGDNQRMLAGLNNNWLLGHWEGSTINYFAGGPVYGIGNPGQSSPNDTNWRIYAGTANIAGDSWGLYTNASLTAQNADGSEGFNGLQVGRQSGGGETSNGQVCFIAVYNRVLSAAEITSNYNALKYKVGL